VSGNQLLLLLGAADAERLGPLLEEIALDADAVLYQPDEPVTHVYFPHEGVVSLQIPGRDGALVEAATVGNEGVVGLGGLTSGDTSYTRQMVRLSGRAARISRDAFLPIVRGSDTLRALLASHVDAFAAHMLQTAACNAQHSTEERLARWLLMAVDRCPGAERINVTHDDLAVAFGVRRPTVTLAMGSLQVAQIIDATRGAIAVVDRAALEDIACECYGAVKRNYERVFARYR
jgi:CRP-like cAMP-binding protein